MICTEQEGGRDGGGGDAMKQSRMDIRSHGLRPKIGSNQCVCGQCGEPFFSVGSFDYHQTITKGVLKCVPPEKRGMMKNEQGWWCKPRREDADD